MVETPAPCEFQPDSVSGIKASCDKPVMCGEKSHQHTLYSSVFTFEKNMRFFEQKTCQEKRVLAALVLAQRKRWWWHKICLLMTRRRWGFFFPKVHLVFRLKKTKIGRKTTLLFRAIGQPAACPHQISSFPR